MFPGRTPDGAARRHRKSGVNRMCITTPPGGREINSRFTHPEGKILDSSDSNFADRVIQNGSRLSGDKTPEQTESPESSRNRGISEQQSFTDNRGSPQDPSGRRRNTFPAQLRSSPADTTPQAGVPRQHRATFPVGRADTTKPRYTLRWELNEKGRNPGQLRKPTDLCFMDSDNLVVAEGKNSRLQIFGRRQEMCIDRSVAPDLVHPTSVCQSQDGHLLLVADLNQVHYFNTHGQQEETWPPDIGRRGADEFTNITALDVNRDGHLVIAEHRRECVVGVYSQDTGQPIRRCKLRSAHSFGQPSYICCDRTTGVTYVADSLKGCVHWFDPDGRHGGTFGDAPGRGDLICPLGMHLSPEGAGAGELLVADKGQHAVAVYNVPGGQFSHFALTEDDGLRDPVAVAATSGTTSGNNTTSGSCPTIAVAQHSLDFGSDEYAVKVYKRARVK